ncbi:Rop guanine nucleotide exchange factor 1 [Camellia lanceoleosa]|uniref:Rop guanine nucleotide exchange factor 1 n=1 Tax=Camellia lanceoleosa TaxID=1840588 RepID=A0ACC0II46_9ERIC|nr:Rop guanine nucleotide exchange factor 1 [Camellia lanceoleosa]
MFPVIGGKDVVWGDKPEKRDTDLSEVDMMKERFSKLLVGEDMSGAGKGVCTALATSNAITNLSATVFGEIWRLEPLASQKKVMWRREMEWLLCVSDSIVELVPSIQQFPGGGTYGSWPRSIKAHLVGGLQLGRKRSGGSHAQRFLQRVYQRMQGRGCSNAGIAQTRYLRQQWRSIAAFLLKWRFHAYLETLPKSGKALSSDIIYRYITS